MGSAMYVLGGNDSYATTDSVLKFDSTQDTWSEVSTMPLPMQEIAACAIGNDIFVFGGYNSLAGGDQDTVFKCDMLTDEWSTLAPMPHASSDHSASVLNGLVYIVGVSDEGNEVLRFDSASDIWSTLEPTLHNRGQCSSFMLGSCLYVAGGNEDLRVERYDTATDTWLPCGANMLEGRCHFGAVTIGAAGPTEEQDLFDSLIAKASSSLS
jgi:hypothetical protein